jgi:hypothetical protein
MNLNESIAYKWIRIEDVAGQKPPLSEPFVEPDIDARSSKVGFFPHFIGIGLGEGPVWVRIA